MSRRLRWRPRLVRGYRFLRCDLPFECGYGRVSLLIGPNPVGWWLTAAGPSSCSDEELAATGDRLAAYPSVDEAKAALAAMYGVRSGGNDSQAVN